MNYACPHCHELLSHDPDSGLPPAMCTRCGGGIQPSSTDAVEPTVPAAKALDAVPAVRSFASFLRWNRSEANATATPEAASDGTPSGSGGDALEAQQDASADAPETPDQDQSTESTADPAEVAQGSAAPVLVDVTTAGDPASDAPADTDATRGPMQEIEDSEPMQIVPSPDDLDPPAASPRVDTPAPPAFAPALPQEESVTPSFTMVPRGSTTGPRTAAWQWAALVVLTLALVLQVLLADRARLAADAQWRPLLHSLCSVFGCSLPTWREPDAFTMLSRDVRPAPDTPGALLVQATFRNDARWSQQWPVMRLSLSDADGRVVGARAFIAAEYLGPTVTQGTLAPGQSAQVMLQVREPQASVVAFSFDFD